MRRGSVQGQVVPASSRFPKEIVGSGGGGHGFSAELAVSLGAELMEFVESFGKMLPAVVSAVKSDIGYGQRTVGEEEFRLFQTLLIDVVGDGAVHVFGEQRLQIGFVDSGVDRQLGNADFLREMGRNVCAGFSQINHTGFFPGMDQTVGQFQKKTEKQQTGQECLVGAVRGKGHIFF